MSNPNLPLQEPAGEKPLQKSADHNAQPELPLAIVKHRLPVAKPTVAGAVWGVLHKIRWLPLIPAIMLSGGVIAMYFQPPGIRVAMRALGLEPGGGTKTRLRFQRPSCLASRLAHHLRPARLWRWRNSFQKAS